MNKTPPTYLPVHRTPKKAGDHEIVNPAIIAWRQQQRSQHESPLP
jgi:hypothetical protein